MKKLFMLAAAALMMNVMVSCGEAKEGDDKKVETTHEHDHEHEGDAPHSHDHAHEGDTTAHDHHDH